MSILINDGKVVDDIIVKCDIGEFVVLVDKLRYHVAPVVKVVNYAIAILHWEKPLLSILSLVFTCMIFIWNPLYVVICVLLPVPPWLLMEYVRMCCKRKSTKKVFDDFVQRKDEAYQQYLKQAAQEKQKERLNTFLDILVGLQRIFHDLIDYFEYLHSVVTWKRWKSSLLLLLGSLFIEFSLYLLDVRIVLCIVTLFVFFVNRYFVMSMQRCVIRGKCFLYSLCYTRKSKIHVDSSSPQQLPVVVVEEKIETMQPEDIDTSCSSESEGEDSEKKEEMSQNSSRNQPSGFAMSMLIPRSIRRRYMGTNCTSCDQPASSILKKRRYCRHCGNSFCARCCSIRVPRSFLGATAPAAYQEKVLVCEACHVFLNNRMRTTSSELVGE